MKSWNPEVSLSIYDENPHGVKRRVQQPTLNPNKRAALSDISNKLILQPKSEVILSFLNFKICL